jgi:uncharacterized membrane protein YfcA
MLLAPLARLLAGRVTNRTGRTASSGDASYGALGTTSGESSRDAYALAPRYELSLLAVVWLGLLGVLVVRGRKGTPSLIGVTPCSVGYWLTTAGGIAWLLGASVLAGRRLVLSVSTSLRQGGRLLEGDVHWDGSRAARALGLAFAAGVLAGLVGVGGGMVLGPMMLELGVLPQVSSATTGTMILLTSSSAAAVFLLGGLVPLDYALALALVAFAGGFAGKVGVAIVVRRFRASALIILILGGLIATSMLATTAAGVLDLKAKFHAGTLRSSLALHTPCST